MVAGSGFRADEAGAMPKPLDFNASRMAWRELPGWLARSTAIALATKGTAIEVPLRVFVALLPVEASV
jgi:hypothetical protein